MSTESHPHFNRLDNVNSVIVFWEKYCTSVPKQVQTWKKQRETILKELEV